MFDAEDEDPDAIVIADMAQPGLAAQAAAAVQNALAQRQVLAEAAAEQAYVAAGGDPNNRLAEGVAGQILLAQEDTLRNRRQQTVRQFYKPPRFSDPDTEDWPTFRAQFETMPTLYGWTERQSCLQLFNAFGGVAASSALESGIMEPGQTLAGALELMENRFLPEAASGDAVTRMEMAHQVAKETILGWHNRIRGLWRKAWPGAKGPIVELMLVKRFAEGLRECGARDAVAREHPQTMQLALHVAQNEASVIMGRVDWKRKISSPAGAGAGLPGVKCSPMEVDSVSKVGAVGYGGANRGDNKNRCFFCDEEGHIKRECPAYDRQLRSKRAPAGRGAGPNRGRGNSNGGRGRGGGRGGNGGHGGRRGQVHAVQESEAVPAEPNVPEEEEDF